MKCRSRSTRYRGQSRQCDAADGAAFDFVADPAGVPRLRLVGSTTGDDLVVEHDAVTFDAALCNSSGLKPWPSFMTKRTRARFRMSSSGPVRKGQCRPRERHCRAERFVDPRACSRLASWVCLDRTPRRGLRRQPSKGASSCGAPVIILAQRRRLARLPCFCRTQMSRRRRSAPST